MGHEGEFVTFPGGPKEGRVGFNPWGIPRDIVLGMDAARSQLGYQQAIGYDDALTVELSGAAARWTAEGVDWAGPGEDVAAVVEAAPGVFFIDVDFADDVSSVNLSFMQDAPWMLGTSGNNRATNVLGENTQATYISSSITSQNWGALSVDTGSDMKLSAINSTVRNSRVTVDGVATTPVAGVTYTGDIAVSLG